MTDEETWRLTRIEKQQEKILESIGRQSAIAAQAAEMQARIDEKLTLLSQSNAAQWDRIDTLRDEAGKIAVVEERVNEQGRSLRKSIAGVWTALLAAGGIVADRLFGG